MWCVIKYLVILMKKINLKTIRNKLLSSIVNIKLNLSGEEITLTGTYNMYNPAMSAKFVNSEELLCTSNLNKETLKENLFSLLDNPLTTHLSDRHGNFLINFQKISELKFAVNFKFLNNDETSSDIKGVFIKFGNSNVLNFNIQEIREQTQKILILNKETLIIGRNINLYFYKTNLSFEYLQQSSLGENTIDLQSISSKFSNDISSYECTLLEKKKLISKKQFEDFYDFSLFNPINEEEFFSQNQRGIIVIIVFTIVLIILVLFFVVYCHLRNKNEEFKYHHFEMENIGRDFTEYGRTEIQNDHI